MEYPARWPRFRVKTTSVLSLSGVDSGLACYQLFPTGTPDTGWVSLARLRISQRS